MACVSGGTYFAISSLRSARMSRSGRVSVSGLDSSRERHFIIMQRAREEFQPCLRHGLSIVSFPATEVAGYFQSSFQDEPRSGELRFITNCELPVAQALYIPGNFIPANLLAKLGLPICLNIFFIWAYWRS